MATVSAAVNTLQLLGEPTRVRLLALLAREELTVAELVQITDLPQSSVSAHLSRLREAGILRDRKSGASTFYAMAAKVPEDARKVWALLEADLDDRLLDADRTRTAHVLRARRNAEAWPDVVAGEMERHYSPGRTWEATAHGFLSLVSLGDVLDAGSGDGTIAQMIAPRARSVTCLDRSEKMIAAARQRLARTKNVTFGVGDVQKMPFEARAFDAVLLFNVLTHAEDPARAVAESARVLRPGGLFAVVTLAAHKHPEATLPYGDVHCGFTVEKLRGMLRRAGFVVEWCEIVSREKRAPHFEVVTASARLPGEEG
jgi:ArsR family transcriptional regulator